MAGATTNTIGDLMYDWVTVLQSKAEGLNASAKSIQDAERKNSPECATRFRKLREEDAKQVQEIKNHLQQLMTRG